MDKLTRWPLLVAAVALIGTAVGVDLSTGPGAGIALAMVLLAAVMLGAFVYAEGARHRGWWHRRGDDEDDAG